MQADYNEIIFIRKNAPKGFIRTLADNVGLDYQQVRTELYALKEDYTDSVIVEARRLLKVMTGKVYSKKQVTA